MNMFIIILSVALLITLLIFIFLIRRVLALQSKLKKEREDIEEIKNNNEGMTEYIRKFNFQISNLLTSKTTDDKIDLLAVLFKTYVDLKKMRGNYDNEEQELESIKNLINELRMKNESDQFMRLIQNSIVGNFKRKFEDTLHEPSVVLSELIKMSCSVYDIASCCNSQRLHAIEQMNHVKLYQCDEMDRTKLKKEIKFVPEYTSGSPIIVQNVYKAVNGLCKDNDCVFYGYWMNNKN